MKIEKALQGKGNLETEIKTFATRQKTSERCEKQWQQRCRVAHQNRKEKQIQ